MSHRRSAREGTRRAYLQETLFSACPDPATHVAHRLLENFPGAAIVLYGSAISVMNEASPGEVLYDFYLILPSYRADRHSPFERVLNRLLPPNVYYLELDSPFGRLRAKYAVVSIAHLETLVSPRTFHSYFWARFAQPFRIITNEKTRSDMEARLLGCAERAVDTFLGRALPLLQEGSAIGDVWHTGLTYSYRAELRAETEGRVSALLARYGDWPSSVSVVPPARAARHVPTGVLRWAAHAMWNVRIFQGGILSVLRLLKGILTFEGGLDYIVWKIKRHTGIHIAVSDWHRKYPFIAAPILGWEYYREKRKQTKAM